MSKHLDAEIKKGEKKDLQQTDVNTIVNGIQRFGDVLLIANKGCGKTNALMGLVRAFRSLGDSRVIVFETFPKWCNEFDKIPFLYIRDGDVIQTDSCIQLSEEDYFVRTERDYSILRGSEIRSAMKQHKDLLFTMAIEDTDRLSYFMASVIYWFYRRHYLIAYKYGLEAIKQRVIFTCEESQNLFDSSIISKKLFNRLRKIYSECRNLKIHFLMASQRMQDLNTKIRGRTRYLIGNVNIDDWELKVRRVLRNSDYREEVLNLEVGQFLYTPNDSIIEFDKFQQQGKPYEVQTKPKPQPTPKPKTLFDKILDRLGLYTLKRSEENEMSMHRQEEKEYICPNCGQTCTKEEHEHGYCLDCDQLELFNDLEGD